MSLKKPQVLVLSLAVAAALTACGKKEDAAPAADAAKPAETAYKLDESKLPGVNRFTVADLDTSKNACDDFGGYVNGKWLAANAIPGDRTITVHLGRVVEEALPPPEVDAIVLDLDSRRPQTEA